MDKPETQTGVFVTEHETGTAINIRARNRFVTVLVTPFAAAICVAALGLASTAHTVQDYITSLSLLAGVGLMVWVTWWVAWRPRLFQIRFLPTGIEVPTARYAYADIASYGVAYYGGEVYDPISNPTPRNYTEGPHLYVDVGGARIPITIALNRRQADAALKFFTYYIEKHRR